MLTDRTPAKQVTRLCASKHKELTSQLNIYQVCDVLSRIDQTGLLAWQVSIDEEVQHDDGEGA